MFCPVYHSSIESTCSVFGSTQCSVLCIIVALRVPVVYLAVHSAQCCVFVVALRVPVVYFAVHSVLSCVL